jgi:hypothetical protein
LNEASPTPPEEGLPDISRGSRRTLLESLSPASPRGEELTVIAGREKAWLMV